MNKADAQTLADEMRGNPEGRKVLAYAVEEIAEKLQLTTGQVLTTLVEIIVSSGLDSPHPGAYIGAHSVLAGGLQALALAREAQQVGASLQTVVEAQSPVVDLAAKRLRSTLAEMGLINSSRSIDAIGVFLLNELRSEPGLARKMREFVRTLTGVLDAN